jgi:hypothetical protein
MFARLLEWATRALLVILILLVLAYFAFSALLS